MGDDLDGSGSPPSAIQTNRNFVRITSKTSASADRGVCISHALSGLSLLRKALSAAVTSGKRVRMFESSCGNSMEMSSIFVETENSQLASVGASGSTLPDTRQVSRDDVKNDERVETAIGPGRSHILCCLFHNPDFIFLSWLSAPPELTLPTRSRSKNWRNELLNRAGNIERRDEKTENQVSGATDCSHSSCWPCHDPIFITSSWFTAPPGLTLTMGSQPNYWRNELLYRGDIERHPWLNRVRVKDIHGAEEFVSHGFSDVRNADLWPPLAVQWLCSYCVSTAHLSVRLEEHFTSGR